ncbi:hypothetical protein C8Q76DRAFT_484707 [Earliella scabrosa]|nr:hypothetical protein C8Q76DRAFT_484707 [Earliella scabrosa]
MIYREGISVVDETMASVVHEQLTIHAPMVASLDNSHHLQSTTTPTSRLSNPSPMMATSAPNSAPAPSLPCTTYSNMLPPRHGRSQPRNRQVFHETYIPRGQDPRVSPDDMHCRWCSHVQDNGRKLDLERHERTHFREPDLWICVGMPIDSAEATAWCANTKSTDATLRDCHGRMFVGGCGRSYSRRDCYQSHLAKTKGKCIGDPYAAYHQGNARGTRY